MATVCGAERPSQSIDSSFDTWLRTNRFSHQDFTISALAAAVKRDQLKVTVIIPGKEVASTIGDVIKKTVLPLVEAKIVSDLVVIDAASKDGTGMAAQAASPHVRVIQRSEIASEFGPSRGKGDALWRALLVTSGDIVGFLDGDTADPCQEHLIGILGPLILHKRISMVRACFDRPFKSENGSISPNNGGRVTEILARPMLNMYWPDLAGFRQPLAGEFAARRTLLERLPFPVGYGIEIASLVDTYHLVGLDGLAEADVGQRQNAHKPLRELTTMAYTILKTAEKRVGQSHVSAGTAQRDGSASMFIPWDNAFRDVDETERPPLLDHRHAKMSETVIYPSPPFVTVHGVRMFRDIGGYHTTSKTRVRPALMYRSGQPDDITKQGKEIFLQLGIGKIFDLRSPIELESHVHGGDFDHRRDSGAEVGNDQAPSDLKKPGAVASAQDHFSELIEEGDIERVQVPVFADEEWAPEKRQARLDKYASAAQGYARAYLHTIVQGVSAFRPIFEHLAQASPCPFLFHCTAGKDRTGVVTMLILLLAGCDHQTIAEEYALNNLDSKQDWGAKATKRLLTQPGLSNNVDAVANVVQAREEYMLATISLFLKEFGSVEQYLTASVGLDEEMLTRVRASIIVA